MEVEKTLFAETQPTLGDVRQHQGAGRLATPLKIIIGEDEGGYINKYSEHWRNAAARGTEVDVLGKCQSA